jgi:DNA repair protein RecO (recombination protein O)
MSSYNDKGFVIKVTQLNETDNIIVIFSKDNGRINAVAKGVKNIKSRKASSLDLLNLIDFRLHKGKGDLDLLIEVKLIEDFSKIKTNLNSINLNFYILEIVDKTIPGHEKNILIFQAIYSFLYLQNGDLLHDLTLLLIVQLKLLDELGYTPMLDECIICSDAIGEGQMRIPSVNEQIGYMCEKHMNLQDIENSIPDTILKIQKYILRNSIPSASRLSLTSDQIKSLFTIQHNWFQSIIEKKINTADIINSILINLNNHEG